MRILHWTESFWPRIGGAEQFVQVLAEETRRRGHECVVVSDVAEGLAAQETLNGVPIRRFPFQAALARRDLHAVVSLSARATDFVRELAPTVVHVHTSQAGAFFFMRTHRTLNPPSIFTTHDAQGLADSASPLLAQLLNAVEGIAGVSTFMTELVVSMCPTAAARIRHIPCGLPLPVQDVSPLPWTPPIILTVGRLVRAKGIDVLLQALACVLDDVPDVRLIVAGDGVCREELQHLAQRLGIDRSVRFMGWVQPRDVVALIDRATVMAVPSRWQEPFGLVALEAMHMARPVVASRVGGLPDAVRHEETGRLVPPDDVGALADALRIVLSDRDSAAAMGMRGREIARAEFDFARSVDRYESLYREVAG